MMFLPASAEALGTRLCPHSGSVANVSLGYYYDRNLASSCIVSSELASLLSLPPADSNSNLYILEDEIKIDAKLVLITGDYLRFERAIHRIGVDTVKGGVTAWLEFEDHEDFRADMRFTLTIPSPICIKAIDHFDNGRFHLHRRLFDHFFGPKASTHRVYSSIVHPDKFRGLTQDQVLEHFTFLVQVQQRLNDPFLKAKVCMLNCLVFGIGLGRGPGECELTEEIVLMLAGNMLNGHYYSAFIALTEPQPIRDSFSLETRRSLKALVESSLGESYKLDSYAMHDLFVEDPFERSVILGALLKIFSNPNVFSCHDAKIWFLYVEQYAELVDRTFVESDRDQLGYLLKLVYRLPFYSAKDDFGYYRSPFPVIYRHLRQRWAFAFEASPSLVDSVKFHIRREKSFWIHRMRFLERALAGSTPSDKTLRALKRDVSKETHGTLIKLLEIVELYLSFSDFPVFQGTTKSIAATEATIMQVSEILILKLDKNAIMLKSLCILSDMRLHRLFAVYMNRIDFSTIGYNKAIPYKTKFLNVLVKNDPTCFATFLETNTLNEYEVKALSDIIEKSESKVAEVILKTFQSFQTSIVAILDDIKIVSWDIPDSLLSHDPTQAGLLFWAFRVVLLHYAKIPLQSTMVYQDLEGHHDVDPMEFEGFLNFFTNRHFGLGNLGQMVQITVPKAEILSRCS